MAKFIATIKAIITRLVFALHGFVAIWQVTIFKKNYFYWYLSSPILLLFFEGIFTLTIKENQEWKWFCPSVFLYLASIVPAIWLLELDKVDRRLRVKEETFNLTSNTNLKELNSLIGVQIKLPEIPLSTETWITLIEQFLMLILIIGRWMLPKGDLTRDQLSQLLLVYIGTAADIIEFFDSFKDDKIASEPLLVLLTLGIWSWSLMQFTVVLTATKSRKSRLTSTGSIINQSDSCCTIDVWGIALNITLQDAPFLVFRLLLITHFQIISYMNVFFTCKNTLVILLQLYRLYVVYSEHGKRRRPKDDFELTNISIISKPDMYGGRKKHKERTKPRKNRAKKVQSEETEDSSEESSEDRKKKIKNCRKDTGYSTGSSHTSVRGHKKSKSRENKKLKKLKRSDQETRGKRRLEEAFSEESESDLSPVEKKEEKRAKKTRSYEKEPTISVSTSDASSE
ncbi:transmembrane protein 26 [Tribolium castaneum]|uniref:Transmembrane protein 26-like Protein n=1 Tax=Tribolium castaneum TaxID=7070 RepID=D6WN33_TRICA|nr:PREDICTED: transmembrane protein 26 [Tribolium castaneum]EFA04344.2 Transmembrane protein 26-like Protein [Tribolium castaneum]|eukprot:XP_008194285.1 PREDICTED: transmembrane protein 26 [Tribolium castaneum]